MQKLQLPVTDGLDKAVNAFVAAKNTQMLAAEKIQAMSNNVVSKINETSNQVNTMIENFDKSTPKPPKTPELPNVQTPQLPKAPKPPQLPKQKKGGRRRRRTRKKH